MLTSIKDRSVIVTGGSKGIGKGIAKVFAKQGARVLIVSRNMEEAERTAREIANEGGIAAAFSGDVTCPDDMNSMASTAVQKHGQIDILCCNAGIFPQTKLENMSGTEWDQVLDTNLKGVFLAIQSCLFKLKESPAGRILLTSSITGPITGYPGWTHYGASKAGQLGFMKTASMEFARYGITVNAVMPGNIITEGLLDLGEEYLETMAASIPLKRLGTVEDIGHAALFLASDEAAYITGQTIVVDGGQTIPESVEALEEA